jgi:peptide/nickel transport system substrate-binding protein
LALFCARSRFAFQEEEIMSVRKSLLIVLSLLIAASLLLAGCGGTAATAPAAKPKVVTFIYTQEFDTLGPLYTDMWFSWTTWQLYVPWAWEFDDKNEAYPRLVTEIPSPDNGGISADGKTITMHLRKDMSWSDGTALTADDFVFTWQMAVSPKNTVTSAYPYDKIAGVTAPDPYTVVVEFTDPFAPWLATMWHGVLPKHILQPIFDAQGTIDGADWLKNPTVGYGAYVLAEWQSGSFARFVRNPNYWGQAPKIDEIFIRFVPDDAAQVNALQTGDADLGTFIPYNDVPKLEAAKIKIVTEPNGYNEGLFFLDDTSGNLGNPGLRDVNVRKAIAMAIDRDAINKDLLLGLTKVPASFWDAMPFYNDPPLTNYPYDPEKAKAMLDAAGWKDSNGDGVRDRDGVELVLTYGTTIRDIRQQAQAVIQQDLAAVGIKVDLQTNDSDVYFASYGQDGPAATGKYDIMEWSDGPVFPDADIYYWLCSEIPGKDYPTGSNWFFTCDPKLDALIQQQSSQVDVNARQQTISQINQLFYDQVYWLGLWQDPDVWAVGPRLTGVKFSGVTPFYNIADWDIVSP